MVIRVLAENTSSSETLGCEHGLSLYIETKSHKFLFDLGQSSLFNENALKLGIDLKKVDFAVISHGHYDHGGGLRSFLEINPEANIYLNEKAFDKHYGEKAGSGKEYIGLDERLLPNERFIYCGDYLKIDNGFELFSGVKGTKFVPTGNADLFMKAGENFIIDDFSHEQNLIITENNKTLLITGCSHKGIINILERFRELKRADPDYVIGGFHLTNPGKKLNENPAVVAGVAEMLLKTKTKYYTCHCTGADSFRHLKAILGDKIDYLSVGNQLEI